MFNIPWFDCNNDIVKFPNPLLALDEPDGLLAAGGNLSIKTLVQAYSQGIFPWFSEDQPILWWSPSERAVITTENIHISKNMTKLLRQERYFVSFDKDFATIIERCSDTSLRSNNQDGTWITTDMQVAYTQLHKVGIAHSVGVYSGAGELVGGLYGVFIKNCFCGESMFSLVPNTSKIALIFLADFLAKYSCQHIDCQLITPHLSSMGAQRVSRESFLQRLSIQTDNYQLINKNWRLL